MPVSTARTRALLTRLTERLNGPMRRAFLKALDTITANMSTAEIERFLVRGDVAGAVKAVLDAGEVGARNILRQQFSTALIAGASTTLRNNAVGKVFGIQFQNVLAGSPRAAAAMDRLDLQFLPRVFDDTRDTLLQFYRDGLANGVNPRTLAQETRSFVGLSPYDLDIAGSYQSELQGGDFASALSRQLRDARFDGLLKRAEAEGRDLTNAEVDQLSGRYVERLVKWRAETWSRTASLNAARESQLVAWQEAMDVAGFQEDEVTKEWVTTMDGREREEHALANGITVGIDEEFPVDGGVQTPGEGVYNCRCTFVVRVIPTQAKDQSTFFDARNFLSQ